MMPNFERTNYDLSMAKKIQTDMYNNATCDTCKPCMPVDSINYLYTEPGLRSLQARFNKNVQLAGVSGDNTHYFSADNQYSNDIPMKSTYNYDATNYYNVAGVGGDNTHYFSADNQYSNDIPMKSTYNYDATNYSNVAGVGIKSCENFNINENFENGPGLVETPQNNIQQSIKNTSKIPFRTITYKSNGKKMTKDLNFNVIYN